MIVASEPSLVISDILCHVLTGSALFFFFVEPFHGWSTHGIQVFLNFERILFWYEMKAYLKKNLFLSYFLSLQATLIVKQPVKNPY